MATDSNIVEDTSKSIQVDEHVIMIVEQDGTIKYGPCVEGKVIYEAIDKSEKKIVALDKEGKHQQAALETFQLFMAATLFEISRLRAELDDLKRQVNPRVGGPL